MRKITSLYREWAKQSYSDGEYTTIVAACRVLDAVAGDWPARRFTANSLRKVREGMIARGWNRVYINRQVQRLVAMFRWAAGHDLLSETVYAKLHTIEPLRRNRTTAPEPEPVQPAKVEQVARIKPLVSRQIWAVIELQILTGARAGELLPLRPIDIDRSGEVWQTRLPDHKTEHQNKKRTINFGPQAQAILLPWLSRPDDAYCFCPHEAEDDRIKTRTAQRKTAAGRGHVATGKRRRLRDHYTTRAYRRAIDRACKKAGIDHWHPHQLRHTAATDIRREFGLVEASLVLGHSSTKVTEAVYAERDEQLVHKVMLQMG